MAEFYNGENGSVLLQMIPKANPGLSLMAANSVDAATEKHVPVVSFEDGLVVIRIGEQPHPMVPEHYIEWVYVQTSFGGVHCSLNPGDPPETKLRLRPDEVEAVYIYCNLHGLWKAKEPVFPPGFSTNDVACSPEFTAGCLNPSDPD